MVRRVRIKDHWGEKRIFTVRSIVAGVVVATLLLSVAARLFYLQVLRYDYYSELSQGNRVRIEPIPPSRGLILDRHGVILAENLPAFQLELVREQVGTPAQLDASLARLVAIGLLDKDDVPSIKRTILSHHVYESVPIKLQLSDEEMAVFAVHRFEFTGIDIRTRLSRHYPFGPLAVHALGYVAAISAQDVQHIDATAYAGTTLIGKLGVERAYENVLHGTPGFREVLVNAAGRPVEKQGVFRPILKMRPPIAGSDLILSLDVRLQRAAEQGLQGLRGAVVAINPNNGDILALASTPGFDPNEFARGLTNKQYNELQQDIDKPLIDRALRGTYPPGSTVKPFYALAALHFGVMTPDQTIFCPGHYNLPGSRHVYHDWKPAGHGTIAMRRAIAQSCDVYFYQVAEKLGIDRMDEFMGVFGFGRPTGIDIAGEKSGLMPSPAWKRRAYKHAADQIWFPGETLIVGIGQGYMLVTPLQLAHAVAGIAARGREFAPRLVIGERAPGTSKVTMLPVKRQRGITGVTPDQWNVIFDGMEEATQPGGTAVRVQAGAPYKLAAKTGTAQVFSLGKNQKYNVKQVAERLRDHAVFIAFAPADEPKLAVAVLVENGGHGGSTDGPIARRIFDEYLLPDKAAMTANAPTTVKAP